MRNKSFVLCLLGLLLLTLPQNIFARDKMFVRYVIDGDTLVLKSGEKVRLIGVDTPESKRRNTPVQYFALEAAAFSKKQAEKQWVELEYGDERRDAYDRILAYVYLPDGRMLNAELIKEGYAFAYTRFPHKYLDEFRQYERDARFKAKGLWGRFSKGGDKYDVFWLGDQANQTFHHPSCPKGACLPDFQLVKFRSKYAPRDQGYKPCKTCVKKAML